MTEDGYKVLEEYLSEMDRHFSDDLLTLKSSILPVDDQEIADDYEKRIETVFSIDGQELMWCGLLIDKDEDAIQYLNRLNWSYYDFRVKEAYKKAYIFLKEKSGVSL